ncbi:MAG TPA: hypothetical protein VF974_02860 [Patescibacteria group bacterium]
MFPHTVYLRPNPRLPKVIALGVLLDYIRQKGGTLPQVHMVPADEQRAGTGIYQLDCGPNEYRERHYLSELAVVMKDFGIPMDRVLMGLDKDMAAHNKGVSLQEKKSFFFMNHSWGSAGWFSGCGWPLIESVPKSHWRWNPQLLEADEGQIVLGDNGRPKFVKGSKPEALTAQNFLAMQLDLILTFLAAERLERPVQMWSEGEKMKGIRSILEAKFTGSNLQQQRVKNGNFQFPTMSGYIRNLWVTGSTVYEIRNKLRPWLRLWDIAGDCYIDADSVKPMLHNRLQNDPPSFGAAFDLGLDKSPAADGNPLIHQRWLAKSKDHIQLVIVRRETGHVVIIVRKPYADKMEGLANRLNGMELERWHLQGIGVYNGSFSRVEVLPTEIPLDALMHIVHEELTAL